MEVILDKKGRDFFYGLNLQTYIESRLYWGVLSLIFCVPCKMNSLKIFGKRFHVSGHILGGSAFRDTVDDEGGQRPHVSHFCSHAGDFLNPHANTLHPELLRQHTTVHNDIFPLQAFCDFSSAATTVGLYQNPYALQPPGQA
jgi:hypothetical protein